METNEVDKQNLRESDSPESKDVKKKYKCTFEGCDASFFRPGRLENHLNVHNNKRPYKCTHKNCDKTYTNPSHLKRHQQTHSITTEVYQCNICTVNISTLSNLNRHYNRVHAQNKLHCQLCNLNFRKKSRYEEHKAYHENKSMYKCDKCDRQFLTHMKLAKHQVNHRVKHYKCPAEDCSKVFEKWSLLLEHKKIEHSDVEYQCTDCNKTFSCISGYNSHSKIHSENRQAIPCPYVNCNRLYYFKRNLHDHIKVKHKGLKFICDICKRELSSKQKVKSHIIIKHTLEKKIFKKKTPQARRDTYIAKKSLLSSLTGIMYNVNVEKQLMNRIPVALLRDRAAEDCDSFSEDDRASDISAKGA